jgi:hypothetical protein
MTAIWHNDGEAWKLLTPVGFPAEAALHDLVVQSPEMLPLSGSPRLVVLGREVQLGTGYADVLAIEDNGRPVVIEVKLSRNSEARRAVVAQVLAYAAYLHGMQLESLELLLSKQLNGATIQDTVAPAWNDLRDWSEVEADLRASLAEGWFRLVLVLDEAPDDLVRLVGYLETITNEQIIVDLITVVPYAVNDTRVVVPQRIDSRNFESALDRQRDKSGTRTRTRSPIVPGAEAFEEFIPEVDEAYREPLAALTAMARKLEDRGHVLLRTTIGSGRRILRMELPGESSPIAALWAEKRHPSISFNTTVAAKRAPVAAGALLALLPEGTNPYIHIEHLTEDALAALEAVCAEAASGR